MALVLVCTCACISGVALATDYLYVSTGNTSVKVLNAEKNTLADSIGGFRYSGPMATSPDGKKLFVADEASIKVINTSSNNVVYSIPYAGAKTDIVDMEAGTRSLLYISNSVGKRVDIYNTDTYSLVAAVSPGSTTGKIALSPDGNRLYVITLGANAKMRNLSVYNTNTGNLLRQRVFQYYLRDLAVSADGNTIYVIGDNITLAKPNVIYRLNAGSLATIRGVKLSGGHQSAVLPCPDNRTVYVLLADTPDYQVLALNSSLVSVIKTYSVPDSSYRMAVSTDSKELYLTCHEGITVINTTSHGVSTIETDFFTYHVELVEKSLPLRLGRTTNMTLVRADHEPETVTATPLPELDSVEPAEDDIVTVEPTASATPTSAAEAPTPTSAAEAPTPTSAAEAPMAEPTQEVTTEASPGASATPGSTDNICCGVPLAVAGLLVLLGPLAVGCRKGRR